MKDIIENPDYLAYRFNFGTENVEFLQVSRSEIRQAHSLSHQQLGPERPFISVPLTELASLLNGDSQRLASNPPRFIFHTAFCSSTYLSRCLDVDGMTVSLREPQILLDAANAKRLQWRSKTTGLGYSDLARLALLLLQKHVEPSEKLIIKPINSVNNIVDELAGFVSPGKTLMLYTGAKNFLLSTLKKGEEAKHTVRSMFDLIRCDFPNLANLRLTDAIHMTDMKLIMTLWRLHIEQASQALQQPGAAGQMASLYGEHLIDDPLRALQAANRFLDLGIPEQQIESIATGSGRFQDAKNAGQSFSTERRKEAYRKVETFYGADIDNGLNWMARNNPGTPLLPVLPGSLL